MTHKSSNQTYFYNRRNNESYFVCVTLMISSSNENIGHALIKIKLGAPEIHTNKLAQFPSAIVGTKEIWRCWRRK